MKQDHTKLTREERITLFRLFQPYYPQLAIAQALGHHRAMVKRELDRNTPTSQPYLPKAAQRTANAPISGQAVRSR